MFFASLSRTRLAVKELYVEIYTRLWAQDERVEKGGSAIITHVPRKTSSSLRSSGGETFYCEVLS